MDTDDEDVFALNEEEDVIIELPQTYNPVEENLIRQLNEVEEQIERGKRQSDEIKLVTDKILEKLHRKALYYDPDSSTSDTDCEHYDEAGVPVSKRQRRKKSVGTQALIVTGVWQRVVDDKWVIGVDLQNTSSRVLASPIVYVMIKGQGELQGVTCLWEMTEGALSRRIDELCPDGGHAVATVVLDMPMFEDSEIVEGHGVISYDIGGSHLQAPIHTFRMSAAQAVDKAMTPRHSAVIEKSILAIKAASVEKIVSIPLGQDLGDKIMRFMEENAFTEIFPDVHVSKHIGTFRHCIIEILLGEDDVKLRIFARSTSQVNIILHLLKAEILEMTERNKHDKLLEAAIALEREIELRLEGLSPRDILNASIVTDLLIPE
ncbi:uncharacterized protein LOC107036314 [Diachasma alloeum]|uniref:uncharacterized protein LOC107036314 n=1 Tax=Diachasma alloeum TaxID=454923 RepID=UPI0007382321|nr:uncharacterized protein LOC107036314 [Diachasma alloeum]